MVAWLPQFLRNDSFSNSLTFLIVPTVFTILCEVINFFHEVGYCIYKKSQVLGPT